MTGQDFKSASQLLVEEHLREGKAFMPLGDGTGEVLVNVSPTLYKRKGKRLFPKADVRKFLWEHRDGRRPHDTRRTVLWSIFDSKLNTSFMGLGVLTARGVGEKMALRNSEVFMVLEMAA